MSLPKSFLFAFALLAVQHERAPKMSNTSSSTSSAMNYPSTFYTSRYNEGLFPFQMHLTTPLAFPFESYPHLPSSYYYPHLAESLNLKLSQTLTRSTHLGSASCYDNEIGKILTSNLFTRMSVSLVDEKMTKINDNGGTDSNCNTINNSSIENKVNARENEVTSSEELSVTVNDAEKMKSTQTLYDSASKVLFLAIRWTKSLPSFNQLPIVEQRKLLNESWPELFIIAAAQSGLMIENELTITSEFMRQFQGLMKQLNSMKIDHFEAACLKAIILFRGSNLIEHTTNQQILLLQNQTLCLLTEKCGGLRLGHLLLILPEVKLIGTIQNLQVI
jgi:hypothetical protein